MTYDSEPDWIYVTLGSLDTPPLPMPDRHFSYEEHPACVTTMTFETFLRFTTLPGTGGLTIASKTGAAGSGNLGWIFSIYRSGTKYYLRFQGSLNGTSFATTINATGNCAASTTAYNHYAFTYSNGTVKFYCAGARKTASPTSIGTGSLFSSTANLTLGTDPINNTWMTANFDEVRMSQNLRYTGAYTVPTAAFTAD